jgi:hypothetical protein
MDVGIDEAGEDEVAGGVEHVGFRRRIEMRADARDDFVFGIDVGAITRIRGDDLAVLDQ